MRRSIFLAVLLLLLNPQSLVSGGQPVPLRQYIVQTSIRETVSTGLLKKQTNKVLAEPKVAVVEGREADIAIGGETMVGSEKVPFGVLLKIKVTPTKDANVLVAGVLEVSTLGETTEDFAVRESCAVHFSKTIGCRQSVRIPMSRTSDCTRWFELTVEEAPSN